MPRRLLLVLAVALAAALAALLLWRPVQTEATRVASPAVPGRDAAAPLATSDAPSLPAARDVSGPGADDVALQGRAGEWIRILVVGPEGNPVPRARLVYGTQWNADLSRRARDGTQTFRSRIYLEPEGSLDVDDGRARIERGLLHGSYTLFVSDPADGAGRPLDLVELGVTGVLAPGAREIRIDLPAGKALRGTVHDGAGAPLSCVHLRVQEAHPENDYRSDDLGETYTREDGGFVFHGLPKEALRLHAAPEGFDSIAVDIEPAQETVEVVLTRKITLTLQVLDAEGRPAAGILLRVDRSPDGTDWSHGSYGVTQQVRTGEDGTGSLEDVPLGARLRIATEWEPGMPDVGLVEQEAVFETTEPLVIRLPAPIAIRGTVVDEAGEPVAWGTVEAVPADAVGDVKPIRAPIQNGRFHVRRLRAGRYRLTARGPPGRAPLVPTEVTAPDDDVRLVLAKGRTLHGRIDSDMPQWVQVRWYGAEGVVKEVTAARDGTFAFEGLGDEPGTLLATEHMRPDDLAAIFEGEDPPPSRCTLLEDVRPSDSPHLLRLGPGMRIDIEIEREGLEGEDTGSALRVEGVRGRIRLAAGSGAWTWMRGTMIESFTLRSLPPGPWEIEVIEQGVARPIATRTVTATGKIVIHLPR